MSSCVHKRVEVVICACRKLDPFVAHFYLLKPQGRQKINFEASHFPWENLSGLTQRVVLHGAARNVVVLCGKPEIGLFDGTASSS